ncbi:MAG: ferritin family protein [Desulfobacterales bacterium]|nr:ferritin family protein [Desulfobacterales bacterium]
MNFKSFKDIIEFAVEREKEAEAFYLEAAEMESMSGLKTLLKEFALEERKHQAMLKGIEKTNLAGYKWEWIPDIKRSNYQVDVPYEKGMSYRDILILAGKREEKALALYNELQDRAESPDVKKVFKALCQEEAKHKLKFETLLDDYMAKMGD